MATFLAGVKYGRRQHALEETKLLVLALKKTGTRDPGNQFREYAKGRVYWNTYLYLSSDYASGLAEDFGPVNEIRLGNAEYRKEPVDHELIRKKALLKLQ
ncbi:MAG: hypothetical protein P1V20_26755 [Verrucomicrobiales bacterium]|nr:hypothetical protein [Verrucomicrobiales bacterium]